jgi:hypothetical protein
MAYYRILKRLLLSREGAYDRDVMNSARHWSLSGANAIIDDQCHRSLGSSFDDDVIESRTVSGMLSGMDAQIFVHTRRTWFLPAVVLFGSSLSLLPTPDPAPQPAGHRNVILIIIDTLRQNHLGYCGYERSTSPHITRLAAASLRFSQGYSQTPWTTPSAGSLPNGKSR